MTQENDAADRAQNINDASEETTAAANESFAQDWLDAEEKERDLSGKTQEYSDQPQ